MEKISGKDIVRNSSFALPIRSKRALRDFFRLASRKDVTRRAVIVAFVVGPIIGCIDYGEKIVYIAMSSDDWLRFGFTFLVPYCVSTWSSVMALRESA